MDNQIFVISIIIIIIIIANPFTTKAPLIIKKYVFMLQISMTSNLNGWSCRTWFDDLFIIKNRKGFCHFCNYVQSDYFTTIPAFLEKYIKFCSYFNSFLICALCHLRSVKIQQEWKPMSYFLTVVFN